MPAVSIRSSAPRRTRIGDAITTPCRGSSAADESLEEGRRADGVVVEQDDCLRGRSGDSRVHSLAEAAVVREGDHPDLRPVLLQEIVCPIRRPVVDDDHLVRERLLVERRKQLLEMVAPLVRRHDHGDIRCRRRGQLRSGRRPASGQDCQRLRAARRGATGASRALRSRQAEARRCPPARGAARSVPSRDRRPSRRRWALRTLESSTRGPSERCV